MYCQSFSRLTAVFVFNVAFAVSSLGGADDAALDTAAIESITGLKGSFNQSENTFKVSKPRAQGVKAAINTQPLAATN